MKIRPMLLVAALLILGAPLVGYLLYQVPALEGTWLRWIAPLAMAMFGAIVALLS